MNVDGATLILSILPELGLFVLAFLVLGLDLATHRRAKPILGWLTAGGVLVVAILGLIFSRPPEDGLLVWGGVLRFDQAGFIFRFLFLVGAGMTALFTIGNSDLYHKGEFYFLMLISTIGMSFMASAADLIMIYLAIETTAIPMYILAGFVTRNEKSVEAGIKYLLFGAMTSAVMLYAFSLLYGFTGTTQIYLIAERLSMSTAPLIAVGLAILMALVGLAFKISAVPLHFWAPDVYEGAPAPVAGFLSTASKAAGFAVLMRVLVVAFPTVTEVWGILIAILAVASMVIGNLLAIPQKNIKRLLAYSSIAQAGYILIGLATGTPSGTSGLLYYLLAYLVTNLAAFGVVELISRTVGSDELAAYKGLGRRSPILGIALLIVLLSLGGIPPFAGFFGKFLVFAAAVESNLIWLALVGILNTVVGLYYYLRVLQVVYQPDEGEGSIPLPAAWRVGLTLCLLGIILLGIFYSPGYDWATAVSSAIWAH